MPKNVISEIYKVNIIDFRQKNNNMSPMHFSSENNAGGQLFIFNFLER